MGELALSCTEIGRVDRRVETEGVVGKRLGDDGKSEGKL